MSTNITISTGTIFRIILILLLIGFVILIRDVLALFFIAIILSSAFDPLVDWLQRKKIPRSLSIIGVYVIFFIVVGGSIYLLTGPIVKQIGDIARAFPEFYTRVNYGIQAWGGNINDIASTQTIDSNLASITKGVTSATSSIFSVLSSIFGGIIGLLGVLVVTFYLTVQEDAVRRFFNSIVPGKHRAHVVNLVGQIQKRMGYWLRGQLILSFIIFCLVYAALSILGVKYALLLALIAGIFEIVPFIGPWISAVPAIFFASSQGLTMAIIVAAVYLVIQQLENSLIVPKVMGKSTGLNPMIVILSIFAGARLGGVIGALLAVPIATAISVYVQSVMNKSK